MLLHVDYTFVACINVKTFTKETQFVACMQTLCRYATIARITADSCCYCIQAPDVYNSMNIYEGRMLFNLENANYIC